MVSFFFALLMLLSCTNINSFFLNKPSVLYNGVRCFSKKKVNDIVFGFKYKPKSIQQSVYVQHLSNSSVPLVVALGPAGSGKTMFACMEAIRQLNERTVKRIVLTRPLIAVEEEEIGFLPGSMITKMDPWTKPMFDIFRELYSTNELNVMVKDGVIEIAPLAFMRGRTFHDAFVIADEMQNSSPSQMLMLTTRLGMRSKMVITGDLQQSDRSDIVQNGLSDFIEKIEKWKLFSDSSNYIAIAQMNSTDVFRSPFVAKILEIYDEKKNDLVYTDGVTPDFLNDSKNDFQKNKTKLRKNNDCSLIPPHHISKHFPLDW
jgi:phosphate starvation-inducible PhoH-like protein